MRISGFDRIVAGSFMFTWFKPANPGATPAYVMLLASMAVPSKTTFRSASYLSGVGWQFAILDRRHRLSETGGIEDHDITRLRRLVKRNGGAVVER